MNPTTMSGGPSNLAPVAQLGEPPNPRSPLHKDPQGCMLAKPEVAGSNPVRGYFFSFGADFRRGFFVTISRRVLIGADLDR
jgi:hypothetical protein